ncbi:unnamed protein product [Somion occarium]|uniref:Coenzyme PQQ synthesis protein F-like C-terminal lobe domain-containing protein n=1 Tax=Somion occarium TaxID=3059160 RepID=A0ABP1E5R9_9APHY
MKFLESLVLQIGGVIRIQVQSEHDPIYLEERIDSFLDEMKTKLERLSEEELQATKATLEKSWTEKPVNLGEEKGFYWLPIESGYLNFLWRDENLAVLPTITEEDLSLFFNTYIHHASPDRAKLSIHMRSLKSSSANPSVSFKSPSANSLSSGSQVSKDPANIGSSAVEDVTASVLPELTQKGFTIQHLA